ncbi:hypothetical protein [Polaromonas sp. CG_9.5]|uniref:hypothetical protein n=1 Tax=Polaromonas sp. CG_9.5 TaxID=3071705 RepID=UPI002E11DF18
MTGGEVTQTTEAPAELRLKPLVALRPLQMFFHPAQSLGKVDALLDAGGPPMNRIRQLHPQFACAMKKRNF